MPCIMWDLSSLARDRTCALDRTSPPALKARSLNPWTTREDPTPLCKVTLVAPISTVGGQVRAPP